MNSRETILHAIKMAKGEELPLSDIHFDPINQTDCLPAFIERLESIGGECQIINSLDEINDWINEAQGKALLVNAIQSTVGFNLDAFRYASARSLENVHTVILKGEVAVAENGAIWIPEQNMGNRLLPFICEHLVLLIDADCIVADMHEAYNRIVAGNKGYGVYIAGPSKTADIEQALVIGAHGPLRLSVFILQNHKAVI